MLWIRINLRTTSGKSEVDIPFHAVATPLNRCRASRAALFVTSVLRLAVRLARHVSTRLVTSHHNF